MVIRIVMEKSFKINLLSVNNYIFSESIKEKSKNFFWKKE